METKTLLKSNLKSHRGTILGVFVLILLGSLSLGTVLTAWLNSSRYVDSELGRLGYGDLTAWVSGLSDAALWRKKFLPWTRWNLSGCSP